MNDIVRVDTERLRARLEVPNSRSGTGLPQNETLTIARWHHIT